MRGCMNLCALREGGVRRWCRANIWVFEFEGTTREQRIRDSRAEKDKTRDMEPRDVAQQVEHKLRKWAQRKGGAVKEYSALKFRGPVKPTVESPLNRFGGGMGPYRDALLQLNSVEYINASPIDGMPHGMPNCIATMCPKRTTFSHFWSMVWELGTSTIVNLTHEMDAVGSGDFDKRERYWPPFDADVANEAKFWPVQVKTVGCEACREVVGLVRYTVEVVSTSMSESSSPAPRRVTLYWFSQWIDFTDSTFIGTQPFSYGARTGG